MRKVPVVLVGKGYWDPMLDWIKETMLKEEGNISEKDLDLFKIVDTARDAMDYILDNIDKTDYNF